MAKKVKDTDYLFLSARIRALERRALNRQRTERLLAASDEEWAQVLSEMGYPVPEGDESGFYAALERRQAETFADLARYMPDPAILDVFRVKYDYHNLKTLIKSRGADCRSLLTDAGRIAASAMADRYERTGKWDHLPPAMAKAAAESQRVLAETGDPQRSDFVLDRAYYEELLTLASASGSDYLLSYARTLIDAANLRSAVRTRRMHRSGAFLRQVLFPGGSVSVDRILASAGGVAALYRPTPLREAAELGDAAAEGGDLTAFEKACDNAVERKVSEWHAVPFGAEVAVGYLASQESELAALRIIYSGRMAGLDADAIRERLRDRNV
ncbi:MAG: V-type ATPase subunit [Oscillospiraceae bacterium]|nr:V-type ATPase subunit [Oscillospiraceae bacterium]